MSVNRFTRVVFSTRSWATCISSSLRCACFRLRDRRADSLLDNILQHPFQKITISDLASQQDMTKISWQQSGTSKSTDRPTQKDYKSFLRYHQVPTTIPTTSQLLPTVAVPHFPNLQGSTIHTSSNVSNSFNWPICQILKLQQKDCLLSCKCTHFQCLVTIWTPLNFSTLI
jgi:hypothetical protein